MPRSLEEVVKISVSLVGHVTLEDGDVALGVELGEVDKIGLELIVVALSGSIEEEEDRLLVTPGKAVKALAEGSRVVESLKTKKKNSVGGRSFKNHASTYIHVIVFSI